MSKLTILQALVLGGLSPVGACAMGGNMMAESGMKANIAQRGMTKLTDAEYTAAADAGTIDFSRDGVGYGLCQWTYPTRKAALLKWSKTFGLSVGDEAMQVQFCLKELEQDYPALLDYLKATKLLYEAAGKVCTEYERPAVNNIRVRADFANELFMQYGTELETQRQGSSSVEFAPDIDREPSSYIIGTVRSGDHTPEAKYLKALLQELGYDVCWLGLDACLRDYQRRQGLTADGICGEKTWRELLK